MTYEKLPSKLAEDNLGVFSVYKNGDIIGYKVDARFLNAVEYGVPRARARVVIIGNRIGVDNP